MRKRFILLIVALAAMLVAAWGQKGPQTPPREFTNSVGMKFVRIEPGSFKMGREDGLNQDVTLSKAFYMQTTEVTQAQWQAVMGTNPSDFKGPDRPAEMVSWDDIQEFLRKLNAREKDTRYRLPTEAEWEYACRAGGQEPDTAPHLDEVAWGSGNSARATHPVGQKKPNVWGLYDIRGNVAEWVQDRYGEYSASKQVDPQGPAVGRPRVVRGGSWNDNDSAAFRCHDRVMTMPESRLHDVGFRCARAF